MTGERALGDADVVVVGAGVIGSAVAYRLSQAGARVTVVDANPAGDGATSNSFCWVNGFNKYPVGYYRLNTSSIREHKELQDEVGGRWLYTPGALHWSSGGRAGFTSDLDQTVRRMRSWGARIDAYSPEEVRARLEPDLELDGTVDRVYWVADEGWIYPAVMIGALLGRAQQEYGLTVTVGNVVGFTGGPRAVDGVRLASGTVIGGDIVILATGQRTSDLARLAGGSVPIETSPGTLLVTEPIATTVRHILVGPDIYVRPDGAGRLRISSETLLGRHVEPDQADSDPDVVEALRGLKEVLPAAWGARVEHVLNGIRPLPTDGYPVAGFDGEVDGLYYVFSHSGITLSAMLAKLVVDHLNHVESDDFDGFSPTRFADVSRSRIGPAAE
jgi:glycine/D-amino acid oxidase-like deaminating enzyme